jgi:replicative DNA helicase
VNAASRILLHNLDAEKAVLCAILTRQNALDDIAPILATDDFYSPAHRIIYDAAKAVHAEAAKPDFIAVHERLRATGKTNEVGGSVYLAEITEPIISMPNALYHAEIVRQLARRRDLDQVGRGLVECAYNPAINFETVEREADAIIENMRQGREFDSDSTGAGDYADDYLQGLADLRENRGARSVPTPFVDLNHYIVGFTEGEVTVLGGRPGTGKTALALNMLEHAATQGYPCGIFSLEMTRALLTNRLFATKAQVNAQHFRTGQFSHEEWGRIQEYAKTFKTLPIRFYDRPYIKPSKFRQVCRAWKRKHGLRFVLVDYLQLMQPEERSQNREREVAEISRMIKITATELELPILLLCQLNRDCEKRSSGKPIISDLRESGATEQDADMIIFIVPWKPQTGVDPVVEIDVAKGRNNAVGSLKLVYRRKYLKFDNYEEWRGMGAA